MIYLVRHGQTEFNLSGRHQGHVDSPLTHVGREQARRAGMKLATLIDPAEAVIISSPLGRAAETARLLAEAAGLTRAIEYDADLREVAMGSYEGLTEDEIAERWLSLERPKNGAMSFVAHDGESLTQLAQRLERAFKRVSDPYATQILVSHGVAGRVLRTIYLGHGIETAETLDQPQDAVFRLDAGCETRIDF